MLVICTQCVQIRLKSEVEYMMKIFPKALAAVFLTAGLLSCSNGLSDPLEAASSRKGASARASTASTSESSRRVVGYFCEWGIYGAHNNYYVTSIPYSKLTHINYAFVGLDPSTHAVQILDPWATTDIVYPGESWDTQYKGNLGMLKKMKLEYPGVKVLISVGGWTRSNGFHSAAATAESRKTTADNLVAFMKQYGLDGIDIDWEYPGINRDKDSGDQYDMGAPGGIEDKENYTLFLKAIREALDAQETTDGTHYELTAAVGVGYDKIEVTNPGDYCQYLDALNLMSYDMHGGFETAIGHQAPLYANTAHDTHSELVNERYNIDWAVNKFLELGVPAEKIVVGIPFYSRGWNNVSGGWDVDGDGQADGMFGTGGSTLAGTWGTGGQSPYFVVRQLEGTSGWTKYRDTISKACWLYNRSAKELYTYDDEETVRTKMDYIINKNLGGAMYWELDGDDWQNGYDLVNIVADAMLGNDWNPGDTGSGTGGDSGSGSDTGTGSGSDSGDTTVPTDGPATGIPGTPSIEQTTWNGEATFGIKMNMWWGQNGTLVELYENGTKVQSATLTDNSPSAQSYTFTVSGKSNGAYEYVAKLTNRFGTTTSNTVKYTVTQGTSGGSSGSDTGSGTGSETGSGSGSGDSSGSGTVTGKAWTIGTYYAVGDTCVYDGILYTCRIANTAIATWEPPAVPALWVAGGAATADDSGNTNTGGGGTDNSNNNGSDTGTGTDNSGNNTYNPVNTELPKHIMSSYWHNWDSGTPFIPLSNVDKDWDVINVAFAEPVTPGSGNGQMKFSPCTANGYTAQQFKADIAAIHAEGRRVVLSIGGYEGYFSLDSTSAVNTFVSQIEGFIQEYSFDGIDIDLEQTSLAMNSGNDPDFRNPTSPKIVNMISAIRQICAKHDGNFILSWAPETFYLQMGHQFYAGLNGYVDNRSGSYIPMIYALRDLTTYVQAQLYNSGSIMDENDNVCYMGTTDGIVAMCRMLIKGFTVNGNSSYFFPGLRPDQVVIAVPASQGAAGSGQISNSGLQAAYARLNAAYPGMRGFMSWSINWDAFQNSNSFVDQNASYLDTID
ncbi:MAG TPA: hypothetical protein DCL73_15345 [Treponema sp.]|nr:hypothetical protein [Treponema sp.]